MKKFLALRNSRTKTIGNYVNTQLLDRLSLHVPYFGITLETKREETQYRLAEDFGRAMLVPITIKNTDKES